MKKGTPGKGGETDTNAQKKARKFGSDPDDDQEDDFRYFYDDLRK